MSSVPKMDTPALTATKSFHWATRLAPRTAPHSARKKLYAKPFPLQEIFFGFHAVAPAQCSTAGTPRSHFQAYQTTQEKIKSHPVGKISTGMKQRNEPLFTSWQLVSASLQPPQSALLCPFFPNESPPFRSASPHPYQPPHGQIPRACRLAKESRQW